MSVEITSPSVLSSEPSTNPSSNAYQSSKVSGAATTVGTFSGSSSRYIRVKQRVKKPCCANPAEEMVRRWLEVLKNTVPTVDLADISLAMTPVNAQRRQFAPQYAHNTYAEMLQKENAVGDYTSSLSSSWMSNATRQSLIALLEHLHEARRYSIETLHLAVSLADRHLANLIRRGVTEEGSPCLATLAVTCVTMAAKIEEHT